MKKRVLSILLTLLLACSLFTIGASAAERFSPYEGLLRQVLYETWGMGCGTFVDFDGDGQSELIFVRPAKDDRGPIVYVYRAHEDQTSGQYGYETVLYAPFRTVAGGQSEYQVLLVETKSGEPGLMLETAGTNTADSPETYRWLIDDYSFVSLYLYRNGRFAQTEAGEAAIWHTAPDGNGNAYFYPDLSTIRINMQDVSMEQYAAWYEAFNDTLTVYGALSPDGSLGGLSGNELLSLAVTGFYDANYTKYYAEPVKWAADKGITNGTSDYVFSPDAACTRAQVVTFLWRAAGSPAPRSSRNPFRDVQSGAYYYKAVLWAVEQGITNGTSDTAFSPNDPCTRAQVVSFLYRSAGSPRVSAANPFRDVTSGKYYYEAVLWAVKNDVTSGTTATTFSPNDTCTRAQIVTFLYRYLA
ncbi:MAG: S-layer homology domain-containing protein [Oscillospiraceae bacterium]|nr:S-layer homology domain-containing protein [Oscillospiraceae bacterium]